MELITGGAGLLGGHLAKTLIGDGVPARLFDFRTPERVPDGAEFVCGDIRSERDVRAALEGVETVYHLAALMHVGGGSPALARSVNIGGLQNLMDCAEKSDVRRIVFASTIELYGVKPEVPCREDSPKNPPPGYPSHKLQGERMLSDFSLRTGVETVFPRFPMILGAGFYHFKLILWFFEAISRNLPVFVLDDGARKGRMVAARDAVAGLILCARTHGVCREAFNICADDVFTHRSFLEDVIKKTGSKSRVFSIPSAVAAPVEAALQSLGLSPVAREHFQFSLSDCDYSIDKAKRVLGYRPTTGAASAMAETYYSYISGGRAELKKELSNDLLKH
jgi:nucleoside-diphosphate-sugar epimerase